MEHELRTILTEAVRADRTDFANQAAAFRRRLAGRRHEAAVALWRRTAAREISPREADAALALIGASAPRRSLPDHRLLRPVSSSKLGVSIADLRAV